MKIIRKNNPKFIHINIESLLFLPQLEDKVYRLLRKLLSNKKTNKYIYNLDFSVFLSEILCALPKIQNKQTVFC